jgi:signal transduction histidine kinase
VIPRLHPLDVAWAGFAALMLVFTWYADFGMTIPYHLLFVSFALVYGFRMWSQRVSTVILGTITVLTGVVFLRAYYRGEIELDELSEVPLMPLIVTFMVWHGLRRVAAQRQVEQLAVLESSRVDRQREFLRDTSHAIRTPVTIARGYVELMRLNTERESARNDADEVLHQLDRLGELAGRLLLMEALDTTGALRCAPVDVASLVRAVGERWREAVPRQWTVIAPDPVVVSADHARLEEALDVLIENAIRFTDETDVIRLSVTVKGPVVVLEVADSGPGIPDEDRERVFDRFFHRPPPGQGSGNGLGLALVRSIVRAHEGAVWATEALEGGALLVVTLPVGSLTRHPSGGTAPLVETMARMPRQMPSASSDLPATS